ncbi:LPXTG cell wall anchor domain-containing protein [Streptomyces sp. NPDC051555]|uniref:LPXTG cell wall anchor domain-containing protein n=1 Tax=Streptomyces sp. NPDC051555 TaxID=3365657 RepID=UPI00378F75DA
MRKSISLLAVAGSVALGLTTPAAAADPVLPLIGPSAVGLRLHPGTPTGVAKESRLVFTLPEPAAGDAAQVPRGEVTFTVDLGKLAGIADVRENPAVAHPECVRAAATLVCKDPGTAGVRPGIDLLIGAAKGSADGAAADLAVTATLQGATIRPATTKVSVGGPDLVMEKLPLKADLVPGQKQPVALAFANTGNRAAHGVVLELTATRGMEFVESYDNCVTRGGGRTAVTLCSFEGDFAPGEAWELADPLTIKATERAYEDQLGYGIYETGSRPDGASALSTPAGKGTGKTLAVKKHGAVTSGKSATDLEPGDNRREFAFRTANTADFGATGATVPAKAGQTVTAEVGFRNQGPAWIDRARIGEAPVAVARTDVRVPAGTSVTKKPEACRAVNADGSERTAQQQLGAPRYFCESAATVLENGKEGYAFELRVDKIVEGAAGKGSVSVGEAGPQGVTPHRFDPKTGNNTAEIVLDAKGGASPSPSGSPSGSPSPSTSPSPTTSVSAGASSNTATGGAAGAQGGKGPLASTGSSAAPLALGAAMLLAAGGALFVAFRRRSGRA